MARKQVCGKQISRVAFIARCLLAAIALAAAPLLAQEQEKKGAEQQKSVSTQKKSAPVQQKGTDQQKAVSTQKKSTPTQQKGTTQQKASPTSTQKKSAAAAVAESEAVSAVEREISQTQGALDSIKAELAKGRARFKELQSEEGNYLTRLEQIEKNISASGRYAELVQRQIDTTENEIIALGDSLTKAETDLHSARELMKKRLRSAYMTGETSKLQMLLTARSPSEFVHRVRYFQDLNRYDKRLAESIRAGIVSVGEKRAAQEESRGELVRLLADKKKEQQSLAAEESERRAVLEDIRTKKSAHETMVAELEEAQNELNALIRVLEGRRKKVKEDEDRKASVSFEKRKGKLPWPLRGEISRKFGNVVHPVYKTVTPNNGIDITAKKGAVVKSVAPGEVALVKWLRGYGQCVFIDHSGGFYTLYAHLDNVSVSENRAVAEGSEVGKAGETGTSGGPKLHFEIKRRAESLNPEDWLEK